MNITVLRISLILSVKFFFIFLLTPCDRLCKEKFNDFLKSFFESFY